MINKMLLNTIIYIFILIPSSLWAGISDSIRQQYPPHEFLLGIAEVEGTKDIYTDIRRAEVLARLEIARQIKVRVTEKTIDIMCEGSGKGLFASVKECSNQIVMTVELTVDETIEGSNIVAKGQDKDRGIVYAVAVLPRDNIVSWAENGFKRAVEKAEQFLKEAEEAKDKIVKSQYLKNAKEELLKAGIYNSESIEDVRLRADGMFKEIAEEIKKIEGSVQ